MPQELGWRPAQDGVGGFDVVTEENPLPIQIIRTPPLTRNQAPFPVPFTFPLVGSVAMIVKAGQGLLMSVIATNINAAVRYFQVFNLAVVPASTNVPVLSIPIPAGTATVPGALVLDGDWLGPEGFYLSNGISLGVSTAAASYTAATASDHVVTGLFL